MTDFSRLTQYINDYFPERIYNTDDIRDWAQDNVPVWKYMDSNTKDGILGDWEEFIAESIEEDLEGIREGIGAKTVSFWDRLGRFVRRLFRR